MALPQLPAPAAEPVKGVFRKLWDVFSGQDIPSWVVPAFGAVAAAPVLSYWLDKRERKKAWEEEMRKRYWMGQIGPLASLPRGPGGIPVHPSLMKRAALDVREALGADPTEDIGNRMEAAKKENKATAVKRLSGHAESYTDADKEPEKKEKESITVGAGSPAAMGGY